MANAARTVAAVPGPSGIPLDPALYQLGDLGAGHPENERDIGEQPVPRAEDCCPGAAALHVAVAAPAKLGGPQEAKEPRPPPGGGAWPGR
jgi:hypothetical protein